MLKVLLMTGMWRVAIALPGKALADKYFEICYQRGGAK